MASVYQSQELIDVLKDAGLQPKSYSGRGMYGRYCVSVHDADRWDIAKELAAVELDSVPSPLEDQLGLGNVLYWPSYPWPTEELDELDANDIDFNNDDLED